MARSRGVGGASPKGRQELGSKAIKNIFGNCRRKATTGGNRFLFALVLLGKEGDFRYSFSENTLPIEVGNRGSISLPLLPPFHTTTLGNHKALFLYNVLNNVTLK